MDIIEGNKIIAQFDEWIYCNDDTENYPNVYWYADTNVGRMLSDGDFEYHSSWDWLMPVVEKIEDFGFETSLFTNKSKLSCKYDFRIFESEILETKCRVIDNTADTKIKSVWNCVIEFINWYNESNTNP